MKTTLVFIAIICFTNNVLGQISIKPELSFGVNYITSYRKKMSNPDIVKTLPIHSGSVAVLCDYSFNDTSYNIGFGVGLLLRPAVFILRDQDLSMYSEDINLSQMTFGFDSFYKKQNYVFIDFPIYFKRNYKNGFSILAGLGFKYYCSELVKHNPHLSRLVLKKFNWCPIIGFGYNIKNRFSLTLKAEPEVSPFIKSPDTEYKVIFSNYNFLFSFGYKFTID
ncbi:MAG TPA: outer membrane beta-barrel protein [Bacteroidales bacterium]|nr:outer membrane beta-barrel protein [Bacteroidales bacterium]